MKRQDAATPEGKAKCWKDDLGGDKARGHSWRRNQGKHEASTWEEGSGSEQAVMGAVWGQRTFIPGKNLAVTAPQKWGFKYRCIPSRTKLQL